MSRAWETIREFNVYFVAVKFDDGVGIVNKPLSFAFFLDRDQGSSLSSVFSVIQTASRK